MDIAGAGGHVNLSHGNLASLPPELFVIPSTNGVGSGGVGSVGAASSAVAGASLASPSSPAGVRRSGSNEGGGAGLGPRRSANSGPVPIFSLDVSHNFLTEVAPEIGTLTTLVELNLAHNQLMTLPDRITALQALVRGIVVQPVLVLVWCLCWRWCFRLLWTVRSLWSGFLFDGMPRFNVVDAARIDDVLRSCHWWLPLPGCCVCMSR